MSLFIVGLDNTIVNVALPAIRRDLGASVSELQWTVDAYTLVLASLLIFSGSTADRLGRARIFQIGLVLFTLGSLLCSVAPSAGALIAFRMLQAVGGSMLNPVAMSIIRNTFEDPRERAQAIGIWAGVIGVSMALGPVIGGLLIDAVSWRAIFWINVPVGLLAAVLTHRFVPESRAPRARRIDPAGQVLVMVVLGSVTYAIIEGATAGYGAPQIVACVVAAVVALAVLVVHEQHRRDPLIDPRFFRSAPFSAATIIAVCAFAALGGFLFLNTLYLQDERGLSALEAGLYTVPMAAMTVVAGPLSGVIVGRRGTGPSLVVGGTAIAVAGVMLTGLEASTPVGPLIAAYVVFGLGFGLVNPPITTTAVSGMPPAQAGVAAAIASTSRQIGVSLGVAIVGAIGVSAARRGAALPHAGHGGWWFLAACGLAIVALGVASNTRWATRTARRTAALVGEGLP